MTASSLRARVRRLEHRRVGGFRLIELLADAAQVSPEVRVAWLADARRQWPLGPTLEQLVIAGLEVRGVAA